MANLTSNQWEPANNAKLHPGELRGRVRVAVGVVDDVASGSPAVTETISFFKLPKNAIIHDMWLFADTISALVLDVGDTNDTDGLFDGADLTTSDRHYKLSNGDEGTNGYHINTTDPELKLWELLGYSTAADAPEEIEVIGTAATGATGTGVVVLKAFYTVD